MTPFVDAMSLATKCAPPRVRFWKSERREGLCSRCGAGDFPAAPTVDFHTFPNACLGCPMAPLTPIHTRDWATLREPCTGQGTSGLFVVPCVQTGKALGLLALDWLPGVRCTCLQPRGRLSSEPIYTLRVLCSFEGPCS